jgi:hypothetical protein
MDGHELSPGERREPWHMIVELQRRRGAAITAA